MNYHLNFNLLLQGYDYEYIREEELRCKANHNREWKYDPATNTWACPLQRFEDDDSLSEARLARLRGSTKAVN